MKLTTKQLRKMIQEEMSSVVFEDRGKTISLSREAAEWLYNFLAMGPGPGLQEIDDIRLRSEVIESL